ncbi:hypothetical protein NOK12_35400 [Nocardioides sp. OK12]|uniref:cupin domain-containing protein n=1 Tax=Nocardioides sp. OK12 TaxID=2758661 RepID=UPI0021C2CE6C|nr:cupin domain-containing protein [Nocardioides sp. OK12]GHJ61022.1 hypothetical protein NOK12_35400 [Nocardioides sp. OK12]
MEAVSLVRLGHEHLSRAAGATAGRSSVTVHGGQGYALHQTLIALAAGHGLDEHRHTGEATLQVVHGTVDLVTSDDTVRLRTGDHAVVPAAAHSVAASEDSVVLLTTTAGH